MEIDWDKVWNRGADLVEGLGEAYINARYQNVAKPGGETITEPQGPQPKPEAMGWPVSPVWIAGGLVAAALLYVVVKRQKA